MNSTHHQNANARRKSRPTITWPTPETGLVSGMFDGTPAWRRAVFGVADLYATRPGLCEATKGQYPPRFVWWLERWTRGELTRWQNKRTPTFRQNQRRALVLAALDRVDWDALAHHFEAQAERDRTECVEADATAVQRRAEP